jgi:hypothetical protein
MLDDQPAIGEIDVVGHLAGKAHLMGDEDAGHAFGGEVLDRHQNLLLRLGIERGGDLVEQHHLGVHRQRAGNRDALLLASRQFARIGRELVGKADLGEQLARARLDLRLVLLEHMDRRHHHVLQRVLVREQIVLLEDDADIASQAELVEILVVDLAPGELDRALADRHQAVDATQQRRFSRARRADDADGLAAPDGQCRHPSAPSARRRISRHPRRRRRARPIHAGLPSGLKLSR